jgi:hypothetical protein
VFLRVFSIHRQGLSLLGEVDRATPVDNQRSRGAAIAGFRAELFESRIELCRDSTKSRVSEPFGRSGTLVHIKTGLPACLTPPWKYIFAKTSTSTEDKQPLLHPNAEESQSSRPYPIASGAA